MTTSSAGLVELHTDHLESHYNPRPNVCWNPIAAPQSHAAQIAASGITLPPIVAIVLRSPAAAGMNGRGGVPVGKQAGFSRVSMRGSVPFMRAIARRRRVA